MQKRSRMPVDPSKLARRIVDLATGNAQPDPNDKKDPAAVALGRKGGLKGGNATARMADVSKNTVLKLLADLGPVCAAYQRQAFVNLKCKRVQCDEIWGFCNAKAKNVPAEHRGEWGYGDVWTWT